MAAKKRKIINYRQLKVAEIWERDPKQTLAVITKILADEFGIKVSLPTVALDIRAFEKRNLAKNDAIVTAVKQQLTKEYEYIYGEAVGAWIRSLEDKQVFATKSGLSGKVETNNRSESQTGNPALLGQAQNALDAIAKLYGLDAPTKIEGSAKVAIEIVEVVKDYGKTE